MRIRRNNWIIRRFALAFAVAAVAAPTAQARVDEAGGFTSASVRGEYIKAGSQSSSKQYIPGVSDFPSAIATTEYVAGMQNYVAGVTDFPKAITSAKIGGTPVGMPHAGLNDYLRSRDGVELVRVAPRSTARSFDGIENVRVEPRTVESPSLVASPGFEWRDAGIGAGVALLLVALGGGALLASRNAKPQTA
jgi:hypothetical protein